SLRALGRDGARIVGALGADDAGNKVGVNLIARTGAADNGVQVLRLLRLSGGLFRGGRRRFEALDLRCGNIDVAAVWSGVHVEACGVANRLMPLVPDAEPIAQVRKFRGVKLRRQPQSQKAE